MDKSTDIRRCGTKYKSSGNSLSFYESKDTIIFNTNTQKFNDKVEFYVFVWNAETLT